MAPRKRTNKKQQNNCKSAKLQAFLQDFDDEVEARVAQMKEKLHHLLALLDKVYGMALIKLPVAIRKIPWLEYSQSEKPKSPGTDDTKEREELDAAVKNIKAEDLALCLKSVKKMSKKKGGATSTSEDENTLSTTRKTRAARKPPATSKKAKVVSVSKRGNSVRRSSKKPLVTPARSMLDSSLMMGPTPLVTPRFDPRLPKTPAVRVPRHRERVYSISVNGSPIAAGSEDIVISVPVGNGESIQLLASQMDTVDLDETALRSIRVLQNRLTALCGTSE